MTTEHDKESFAKDKFAPNPQDPGAAHAERDDVLGQSAPALHEDGSPKKPTATLAGLPTDVTQVQDQLVHTNQDTGAKTLLGRVREGFVELTKWGERFFEGKPTLEVTPVDGATVPAAVADSTDALQNDGLPATSDKHLTLGVGGHALDLNASTLANDGLPATTKRQPDVLMAPGLFDNTVDAQVKPVPESHTGIAPSTGMVAGAAEPAASGAPTPVVQGTSADQSVAGNNRSAQTSP